MDACSKVTEMRFLVVDDSSTMRRIIIRNLKELGVRDVVEADHGEEAWRTLEDQGADFIVCDWKMPVMDGITLLRKVRESERHASLPFLMVTAEAQACNLMEAIAGGVSNYLTKPFPAHMFKMKVRAILRCGPAPSPEA
ncbi:MAG: response regulator [Desulfovibrionaceae bacterium]|jgi:two-component system chemotaxis response regulator CheY|nr:response regulator [Desulfovibrionaceae bacterium]